MALLRQRRAFDPELALVAEHNGQVVGHVLFAPYQMRLLDQTIPAINLAPLAVACHGQPPPQAPSPFQGHSVICDIAQLLALN